MGSHPVFATAVHALNPPYPRQHVPLGSYIPSSQAYSGTCGHEFIYSRHFPDDLQGAFVKVRYKPTNEVELHQWVEKESWFEEKPIGKIFQSSDLSFIPVDVRFGPRGDLFICDWYNPVKGHMQYSLRDTRRDLVSGRIWRVTAKGRPLAQPPKIAGQPIPALLDLLKSYEYRTRYTAKIELRERDSAEVLRHLDAWTARLDPNDPEHDHHLTEAVWMYRNLRASRPDLLRRLLSSADHHARAAATRQLRWWHADMPDALDLLRKSVNDTSGIVRLEAVLAASYIQSVPAAEAAMDLLKHPMSPTLTYALRTTLDSMAPLLETNLDFKHRQHHYEHFMITSAPEAQTTGKAKRKAAARPDPFDKLNPKVIRIGTVPERMLYTLSEFTVKAGQPVKIIFDNPDASCAHNLLIVQPGTADEIGLAAMEMAKGPEGVQLAFNPPSKQDKILVASKLINPGEQDILRFHAPKTPGRYPYICTFPGHWLVMKGEMIVE
jgi:azurin